MNILPFQEGSVWQLARTLATMTPVDSGSQGQAEGEGYLTALHY
jgi:hypothetical protein